MVTLKIFLKALLPNLPFILPVLLIFLLTLLIGSLIFLYLVDEDNWSIILPSGLLIGLFSFVIYLSFFSYIFKGKDGIQIILFLFLLSGFLLFQKVKKRIPSFKLEKSLNNLGNFFIYSGFLVFMFFVGGNNIYGGDVITYWGIATSFANGNYPIFSPWQPDLLVTHHQGLFIYEGAIYGLLGVNMQLIHTLCSILIIYSGFCLLWGWGKKFSGLNFRSILLPLIIYLSFGAIFILLPKAFDTLLNLEAKRTVASTWPIFSDAKNTLGGSSNLNEIFYISHRALAFDGIFLLILLLLLKFRVSRFLKLMTVFALSVPIISIDESALPSIVSVLLFYLLYLFKTASNIERKKLIKEVLIITFVSVLLFFVVGSSLRDSLFTPSKEAARFQILLSPKSIGSRLGGMRGVELDFGNQNLMLYFPSLLFLIAISLILFIIEPSLSLVLIFWAIFGAFMAYLLIEHTFYPGNQGRFQHMSYILNGLFMGVGVLQLLKKGSRKAVIRVFGWVLVLLLGIPIVFSAIYLSAKAKSDSYPNYNGNIPSYPVLKWAKNNVAQNRLFFVDGYLRDNASSETSMNGIEHYGLKVPVSPAYIKVHTPDIGYEAIDAFLTLSPQYLKDLKIDDVYIKNNQLKYYSRERLEELNNPKFFTKLYVDSEGSFYKIEPEYLTNGTNINEGTIDQLSSIISEGKKVFLDYPPNIDMALRGALWLRLKQQNQIYTEWRAGIFNYIETKMVIYPPDYNIKYDYLILGDKTKPEDICKCVNAQLVWQLGKVRAYKTHE